MTTTNQHAWLRPGVEAVRPALYAGEADVVVHVVDVDAPTRRVWVRFPGSDAVREISTFHLRRINVQ